MGESPREINLAWAAGFFDGEGSTIVTKDGTLVMSLGQCSTEVLDKFSVTLGQGKIYGPYEQKLGWSSKWEWKLCGKYQVAEAMADMWPHLGTIKKNQFLTALSMAKDVSRPGYCKKNIHNLSESGTYSDGRCKPCRQKSNSTRSENKWVGLPTYLTS